MEPQPLSEIAAHYNIIESIEAITATIDEIRAAQNAWSKMNEALHTLGPPANVIAAWDKIRPWINSHAGVMLAQLATLHDQEADLLF
jgi:hypothetical protein